MAKTEMPVIPILILSSCIIIASSLSYSLVKAEEVRAGTSTEAGLPGGGPPPLSRNPFVSAPYGRMDKSPTQGETKLETNNLEKSGEGSGSLGNADKIEATNKIEEANKEYVISELRVKGVLLGLNDPMALLGDRVVRIGDKVGVYIITDINRRGVLLSHGDKIVQIPFE